MTPEGSSGHGVPDTTSPQSSEANLSTEQIRCQSRMELLSTAQLSSLHLIARLHAEFHERCSATDAALAALEHNTDGHDDSDMEEIHELTKSEMDDLEENGGSSYDGSSEDRQDDVLDVPENAAECGHARRGAAYEQWREAEWSWNGGNTLSDTDVEMEEVRDAEEEVEMEVVRDAEEEVEMEEVHDAEEEVESGGGPC